MNRIMLFSILFRYFGRRYLIWFGISLAVLITVISLIQSIELMRRLSGREVQINDFSVTTMALLNIPAVIELCLPFALQAGSMLCFDYWNRTNEFVVSRGFGRSIWSVLNPVICCACLIGAFYVTVINPVGSVTAQQYEAKMNAAFGNQQQKLSISAVKLWKTRKKCFSDYLKSLDNVVGQYQKDIILNVLYTEKTHTIEEFQRKLKQTRERDSLLGSTSHGPHRDNIKILWSGKDIRECGSQGEHKISLILLKLAEINLIKQKTGKYPTILLDDVFAKLDLNRSKKLVSYLNSIKTEEKDPIQTIITTTDVLDVEQTGLILNNKDVKTHKLELSWNI